MTEGGRTEGHVHSTTGQTMKRRGILATAGAAVAAIVAKQTSQPVAVHPNDLALGTLNSTGGLTALNYDRAIPPRCGIEGDRQ